jgi:predicted outer membrane repeat protein
MAVVAAVGVAAVLAGGMMPAAAATATAAAAATSVPCSTSALVKAVSGAASGATLSLARRCTYVLTAALPTVAQDLIIDGNGATLHRSTAAGTAAFTILTITAGNVTLNQLNFTNGNGAITVNGYPADLTVTGGVFRRNTAANGGAIDHTTGIVQVTGASFIDNMATGSGGAIYMDTAFNGGGDQITDCRFVGNTAGGSGGAIYQFATNGVAIAGSTFRGNKAATGGGLYLFAFVGLSSITGTVIHGNSATGNGGGVASGNYGNGVSIGGSKITGNHAGGAGGGIDEEWEQYGAPISNTIIADNSATDGGGVNEVSSPGGNTYTGDTISGNHASGDGGGVNAISSILSFTTTTISGNRADADGGGIASAYDIANGLYGPGDTSFTDSTISRNHAGAQGGGVYNQESLELSGTKVAGNRAVGGGGGIYDDADEATATLTNSSPNGNKPDNCEPLGSITGCTG